MSIRNSFHASGSLLSLAYKDCVDILGHATFMHAIGFEIA